MRACEDCAMRAVIFDMDGVLVLSEDAWFDVYNATLALFSHAAISREAFDAIYGNGTEADRAAYMPERTVDEIDAAYARLFAERHDAVRVNPEAVGTLEALRARGLKAALATNTNRPLAERILAGAGLGALLDAVACANEAGAGKPDPAVVRLAASRLGVPLSECLFVGDSKYDAEAARRAPVAFLGYRFGSEARIESLGELALRIDSGRP